MPVSSVTASPAVPRRRLMATLALSVLVIVIVTAGLIIITEPLVHGWNDTVGLVAGLITSGLAVRVILRLGDPDSARQPPS